MTINLDGSTFTLDGVQLPDGVVRVERDDLGHPIAYSLNHIGVTEMLKSPNERRSMLLGAMSAGLAAGAIQRMAQVAVADPSKTLDKQPSMNLLNEPKEPLSTLLYDSRNGKPAMSKKRQQEKSVSAGLTGKQFRKLEKRIRREKTE